MTDMSCELLRWLQGFMERYNDEGIEEVAQIATTELGFNVPAKAIQLGVKANYILTGWIVAAEEAV